MSDTLNLHEWQDALDIERSFVIDGGAGTGKSELAFQRYLRLLAQADQPEEVLFLIDGKRRLHRVRRRLAAIVQSENSVGLHEDELRARNSELSWNLAEQPDRLQVHTLGSLAAAIVASAPVASGCGAAVRLTDDPEGYYRIAARALLRTLDHDERVAPKLETLLLHLDNDLLRTERLLAGMLRRRVELQHCLKLDEPDNSRSVLQAALEDAVAMTLTEISSSIPGDIVDELASVLSE
ncbi:MAG: UvrD-helicase domain-containing protein, partial [Gammaproteobacteria bacterium]|nr:UvrD-helicase domain-containing protein [Gammaproteobacteria bacterium]